MHAGEYFSHHHDSLPRADRIRRYVNSCLAATTAGTRRTTCEAQLPVTATSCKRVRRHLISLSCNTEQNAGLRNPVCCASLGYSTLSWGSSRHSPLRHSAGRTARAYFLNFCPLGFSLPGHIGSNAHPVVVTSVMLPWDGALLWPESPRLSFDSLERTGLQPRVVT